MFTTHVSATPGASDDFALMLQALTRPQAFADILPDEESVISLIQTHASAVILTPHTVYKLKKPKNFGFFDYSTPTQRRHFCQQEVSLNAPLAPGIYLGVAPVLQYHADQFRFGPILPIANIPEPGASYAGGLVVDYAVVMKRLPDTATLAYHTQAGTASPSLMRDVARHVAAFHAATPTNEQIARFGQLEIIRGNWEENFLQIQPYVGRTLSAATYDHLCAYVSRFLEERAPLFIHRIQAGHIRDCHGDLRLQHIYLLDQRNDMPFHIALLDRIEFNERFRYGDVAAEVAFLSMELDHAGRSDLSRSFSHTYMAATGDQALSELLPFYSCYRACVRGKVLSFQLDEAEVPQEQREIARQQASAFFTLANHYAQGPTSPSLIMIGGLMGTGKSTLAHALQRELGWDLVSSDVLRKQLAQIDPAQPQIDAYGQGIYSQEWTARTYDALRTRACAALAQGRSMILDASFLRKTERQSIARAGSMYGAQVWFIECRCPREVALSRLAQRWSRRLKSGNVPLLEASSASDGRPNLYDIQCSRRDVFIPSQEPDVKHLIVTTTAPCLTNVEQILTALGIPHLACWLNRGSFCSS